MKVAFLDRDGVINIDTGYISSWKEFNYIPGTKRAMRKISDLGYEIIIITNQSGIARGIIELRDLKNMHIKLKEDLKSQNIKILDIFFCPHHKDGSIEKYSINCSCRKPLPGLFNNAIKKYDINLKKSFSVGDKTSDITAAKAAGIKINYLLTSQYHSLGPSKNCFKSLLEVANHKAQDA